MSMAKKKKFGNPAKEKAYREALKKAKQSKRLELNPTYKIGGPDPNKIVFAEVTDTSGKKSATIQWEDNDTIYNGIDTKEKFHKTMKDSAGEYEFIMSAAGSNHVYVTVEGTHYKNFKMDRKSAYWEWDMIWHKDGCPAILKGFEKGGSFDPAVMMHYLAQ
jgi:hypothetical protein